MQKDSHPQLSKTPLSIATVNFKRDAMSGFRSP
jgi:hypothetical protein